MSKFFDSDISKLLETASQSSKKTLSKRKLRELGDVFSLFDKDHNGYLTKDELCHVMHQVTIVNSFIMSCMTHLLTFNHFIN